MAAKFIIERRSEIARMLAPDGSPTERAVEVRSHPISGEWGRILTAPARVLKVPDIRKEYGHTLDSCPFCPGAVEKNTPRFSPDEFDWPRISVGQSLVFPNLLAYSGLCALAVTTEEHFVTLEDLTEPVLVDALRASRAFFHTSRDVRRDLPYRLLHWNYMPPAGSSMVHPHLQLMATSTPPNRLHRLAEGSRRYTDSTWKNAWDALIQWEKDSGERWIGRGALWSWLADPVPQGRYFELVAVHSSKSEVTALADDDFIDLASGLSKVFSYFASQGFWSFNLALMGLPDAGDYFRCQVRITPRTFFPPAGCSDVHFDILEGESMSLRSPEEVAKEVRAFFG